MGHDGKKRKKRGGVQLDLRMSRSKQNQRKQHQHQQRTHTIGSLGVKKIEKMCGFLVSHLFK